MQCPLFLVRLHPSQQRPQKESKDNKSKQRKSAIVNDVYCNCIYIQSFSRHSYPERLTASTGTFPQGKQGEGPCPRTQRHGWKLIRQPSDYQLESLTAQPPVCLHIYFTHFRDSSIYRCLRGQDSFYTTQGLPGVISGKTEGKHPRMTILLP